MKLSKGYKVLAIVVAIAFLDQATKSALKGKSFSVTRFLAVSYVENDGAAFGLLQGSNFLLIIISFIAILIISYYLWKSDNSGVTVSLSLILVGTIGNLIDRVFLGYVIDFIDFKIWPVFNIADSSNTLGAILLVYYLIRDKG